MRGPLVQPQYWTARPEDETPYSDDGGAHFGDLGRLDEDGFLHVTGRVKDTIIRGGSNVNPFEVEDVLRGSPAVQDVCVVGRPDQDLGERAVAFVSPRRAASRRSTTPPPISRSRASRATSGRRACTCSTRCRTAPRARSTGRSCASERGERMTAARYEVGRGEPSCSSTASATTTAPGAASSRR